MGRGPCISDLGGREHYGIVMQALVSHGTFQDIICNSSQLKLDLVVRLALRSDPSWRGSLLPPHPLSAALTVHLS